MSDTESKTKKKESLNTRFQKFEGKRITGDLWSQQVRAKTEKLLTRTTSGAIYTITILVCLYLGPVTTAFLIAAMAWLCCSEFFRMMRMCGRMPSETVGLAAAVAFPIAALLPYIWLKGIILVFALLSAAWYLFTPRANISDVAITIFGPLYTGLLWTSAVNIRMVDPGNRGAFLTFAVMGSVWLNDTFAYFVGTKFGKHKMAPRISPNKSWEGFAGGMVGSIFVWVLIYSLSVVDITLTQAVLTAVVVGLSSVMGDLFESRIKRGVGVKDSGNVMPGHGGLLDRSDSLLFGLTAANFMLCLGGIL